MSKALKIAGAVVAIAAITVVTAGIGTAPAIAASSTVVAGTVVTAGAVAATGASLFGLSVATLTAIGAGLTLAGNLTSKKPSASSTSAGQQLQWKADPGAAIPYIIGRTQAAGNIVAQGSYGGAKNPYQSFVTVYSGGGPIDSFESFSLDKVNTTFGGGGGAVGTLNGFAWLTSQLGAQPGSAALTPPFSGMPGWDASSKLSSYAAAILTLKFDEKGEKFPTGVQKPAAIAKWVKCYDPRLDSTYPGGSGAHRWNDESTWAWTENPWLHGLTWAIGRHSAGKRTIGVGMPVDAIVTASYVEAANVADANAWKAGGGVTSGDDKWNVLKMMAQAGGGEPIRQGASLSCFVNTPRVSLATITAADLADGDVKITAMQPRRNRINGCIARYRSEAHDWEVVDADVVRVATHVTEDGEDRTREVEFPLVQQVTQAVQLAAYEVENSREFGPIVLPLKTKWIAYRAGDAVTVDIPDANLNSQLCVILKRELDPSTGAVALTLRSETTAKHAFALGKTGTAPPTPALSSPVFGAVIDPLATRNYVTYSSTAPASPADGDLWVDTSGTYAVFKLRSGGAWVTGANALSVYNNLSGKPVALADINTTESTKLSGIETNADVTLLVVGTKTVQIACDYTGAAKSGQLPLDANFKLVSSANTDVTTSAAWSATLKSGTASFTIGSATGTLNVTALSTDAVIEASAVYGGKTRTGTLTLVKSLDAAPVGGGGGGGSNPGTTATTSTIANTASTSYGSANAGPITCKAGTAGQVACNFSDAFYRSVNGTSGAYGKVQWRVVGGTWADIASENASDANAVKTGGSEPSNDAGNLSVSATKGSLTAGTDYEFQLLLRGSTSATLNHIGTFAAVGS